MPNVKGNPRNWRDKLHPMFFELAALSLEATKRRDEVDSDCRNALLTLRNEPASKLETEVRSILEQRAKNIEDLQESVDRKLIDINARYPCPPENPLAYPWLQQGYSGHMDGEKEAAGLLKWLHFERHGEALDKTVMQANAGNLDALHKLQRTQEDAFRIQHGRGPLKKFQGDPYHRDLLQIGLCFGMEKLTSEELADCFEEYCPCGKEHDADALKKQRGRLVRELRAMNQRDS